MANEVRTQWMLSVEKLRRERLWAFGVHGGSDLEDRRGTFFEMGFLSSLVVGRCRTTNSFASTSQVARRINIVFRIFCCAAIFSVSL